MTNTSVPSLTDDDIKALKAKVAAGTIRLTSGHHDPNSGEACAMDLIVWRATGEIADHADCVHRLISGHIHYLNDRDGATPESRWELVENAGPAILGTADLSMAHALLAVFAATNGAQIAENINLIRTGKAAAIVRAHAATTGGRAHAATTGGSAHAATTGDWAHAATTGDWAHAATTGGRAHAATTGGRAHAATTGKDTVAASLNGGYVQAGEAGTVIATWRDPDGRRRVTVGYVGEEGIEAGVWYRCDDHGTLVPVDEADWPVIPGFNAPAASQP